jgi:hypothetical protein
MHSLSTIDWLHLPMLRALWVGHSRDGTPISSRDHRRNDLRAGHELGKVMAAWQVEFAIVPRRALATKARVALSQIIETDWWSTERLPAGYSQHLAAIAPPGSSWAAELQTWGEADGNRVDVWFENGKATRMLARVDVRRLDAKFGAMLLQFARVADAVLVRRDGLVVEPLVGAFGAALRTSEAWQYATDPAAYLAAYSEPEDDDQ